MFGTNALELCAGGREARVSTEGLYRVIALPSGRIVADLLDEDHAQSECMQIDEHEEACIALAYPMLDAIERAGLSIADVAIPTGHFYSCEHCLAEPIGRWAFRKIDAPRPRRNLKRRWACGTIEFARTDACRSREVELNARAAAATAAAQEALSRAGVNGR